MWKVRLVGLQHFVGEKLCQQEFCCLVRQTKICFCIFYSPVNRTLCRIKKTLYCRVIQTIAQQPPIYNLSRAQYARQLPLASIHNMPGWQQSTSLDFYNTRPF